MRKTEFAIGEYYHIYNRGVDKRVIFSDENDMNRFLQSMREFNSIEPIGSIYENSFRQLGNRVSKSGRLVDFVCYCLNPNHYHFILKQVSGKGIEKFMHRLGLGYTKYFNQKNVRSGVLFQGAFKAIHINNNEYLLHLSAYVNLNNRVHQLGNRVSKSSWNEYVEKGESLRKTAKKFCLKQPVLGQFRKIQEYKEFAENALRGIREKKDMEKLIME
jgi:putative transposase